MCTPPESMRGNERLESRRKEAQDRMRNCEDGSHMARTARLDNDGLTMRQTEMNFPWTLAGNERYQLQRQLRAQTPYWNDKVELIVFPKQGTRWETDSMVDGIDQEFRGVCCPLQKWWYVNTLAGTSALQNRRSKYYILLGKWLRRSRPDPHPKSCRNAQGACRPRAVHCGYVRNLDLLYGGVRRHQNLCLKQNSFGILASLCRGRNRTPCRRPSPTSHLPHDRRPAHPGLPSVQPGRSRSDPWEQGLPAPDPPTSRSRTRAHAPQAELREWEQRRLLCTSEPPSQSVSGALWHSRSGFRPYQTAPSRSSEAVCSPPSPE